jgi:septum formation protein
MSCPAPIWLASTSPRRRQLLDEAGIAVQVHPPDIDDGTLTPGRVSPPHWVMSLAYLKARRVAELLSQTEAPPTERLVLAADTICVDGDVLMGQPRDAAHARSMLHALRDHNHHTLSGVCLLTLDHQGHCTSRVLFFDAAQVRIGALSDDAIETYLASEQWRGKAGGYNLADRINAGWPIECIGDPTTVMGLPMRRLQPLLSRTTP